MSWGRSADINIVDETIPAQEVVRYWCSYKTTSIRPYGVSMSWPQSNFPRHQKHIRQHAAIFSGKQADSVPAIVEQWGTALNHQQRHVCTDQRILTSQPPIRPFSPNPKQQTVLSIGSSSHLTITSWSHRFSSPILMTNPRHQSLRANLITQPHQWLRSEERARDYIYIYSSMYRGTRMRTGIIHNLPLSSAGVWFSTCLKSRDQAMQMITATEWEWKLGIWTSYHQALRARRSPPCQPDRDRSRPCSS